MTTDLTLTLPTTDGERRTLTVQRSEALWLAATIVRLATDDRATAVRLADLALGIDPDRGR